MKTLLALALVLTSMLSAHAGWTTDYKAALAQAKADNKLVLLDFTGSDWCGYCQLLEKEVLSQRAFNDYAKAHFILVTVDFPHGTTLPDALAKQNDDLQTQFNVDGYPTLIVVNPDGKELGRQSGYAPGSGTDAVIGKLKSISGT